MCRQARKKVALFLAICIDVGCLDVRCYIERADHGSALRALLMVSARFGRVPAWLMPTAPLDRLGSSTLLQASFLVPLALAMLLPINQPKEDQLK